MDSSGNVFYTDLKQVWKIAANNSKSVVVPNVHTHELYVDPQDNLYGEHLWYEGDATKKWGHRVWRLAPGGTLTDVIPPSVGFREDGGDFTFVRDAKGNSYWADFAHPTVIHRKSQDGAAEDFCKGCTFAHVGWMTATRDGVVYFTDGGDVRRIGPDGAVSTVARNLAERRIASSDAENWHEVMGLTTDGGGNLYVAVYGARSVKKVAADGTVTVAARTFWPWAPTGVLVAPNGELWILESSIIGGTRVRRIAKDGKAHTY